MGKKNRRKTMSQSQENNTNQDQVTEIEAPAQELNSEQSEQEESNNWLSENWKLLLGFVLGLALLALGLVAVVQSTANNSYNAGYKAGVEYTITSFENTPWYSRWWAGITGKFPGKK